MSLSSEGKERGKVNLKRREREKERNACFPKEPYNMKVIFNF